MTDATPQDQQHNLATGDTQTDVLTDVLEPQETQASP